MMKIEMRVTWMRVGDPNPQTAGWFDPQADSQWMGVCPINWMVFCVDAF